MEGREPAGVKCGLRLSYNELIRRQGRRESNQRPAVYEIPRIQPQDNPTPKETTNQDAHDIGADGAELFCPGSSVVAKLEGEAARFENASAAKTIDPHSTASVCSQSLTEAPEAGEEPMKQI